MIIGQYRDQGLINQCCEMIKKCSRVILIGSNEMMDSLLRFQGDMVMMQKLVIQNTIYNNNYIEPQADDLIILLSMTGRIAELKPTLIEHLLVGKTILFVLAIKIFFVKKPYF